ncbi:MAG: CDP-alcohol phosphatidyltransferase family protein [candidate division Zixibacteria bacterium]|nr:CDP-alcohol phosphatidyltransferase family protein [candidate division Zixibacteria bacterium]NIR65678.1 CDP-alcohol phosphatidyltransferase family protein [candidate division Zixibacteria bacterium]NIS16009.1 CDP-alcohol phosphatidyltransferase family protein [candidate division Zixibacteria bacterium]NIS47377.1 CDP-alcohol phosphatidyltransferase family protein [candidate division Zixibacteria bacterium]NIT52418.1 CDP-alcohol phosphatidyltransferase family protein [candidate division Zixib
MNKKRRQAYELHSQVAGRFCVKIGLTPNFITFTSLIMSIVAAIVLWKGWFMWGILFIVLTSITDMLDGATARAGNMGTTFGGILDHVLDRYAEFFILSGILLSGKVHPVWPIFAIFGMIMASYSRKAAESIGKIASAEVGWVGRLEKFIVIMIGLALVWFFPQFEPAGLNLLEMALIFVGVVSHITAIQRLFYAKKELDRRAQNG